MVCESATFMQDQNEIRRIVEIPAGSVRLEGELIVPANATGIVVFVHGSGSSRFSPRNQAVAATIRRSRAGTLLFDLLTKDEEAVDQYTRHLRFDIRLLADRLSAATEWLFREADMTGLGVGFFGSSTGGAAALVAAAELAGRIAAVVSRGGRPDLAGDALPRVTAPTLLIVGEYDDVVIKLNLEAMEQMSCKKQLEIVPRATHLFEEPGALDLVAKLASDWFAAHLTQIPKAKVVEV